MIALSLILLFAPLVWELFNDYKKNVGDTNKGEDIFIRCLIAIVAGVVNFLTIDKPILDATILSLAIHFMFFDYLISYILIKNGTLEPPRGTVYKWFSYTAKVGVMENFGLWRGLKPGVRLMVKIGILIAALLIYFI